MRRSVIVVLPLRCPGTAPLGAVFVALLAVSDSGNHIRIVAMTVKTITCSGRFRGVMALCRGGTMAAPTIRLGKELVVGVIDTHILRGKIHGGIYRPNPLKRRRIGQGSACSQPHQSQGYQPKQTSFRL
jgi:hypothetical protein